MDPELAAMTQYIERVASDLVAALKDVPDEVLNQQPALPNTNTLFALGTHTVGMGEFWVLALVAQRPIKRNRSQELIATGSGAALCARIERWASDVRSVLAALPPEALAREITPPHEFAQTGGFGTGPLTGRECLLHVIEHSSLHLGHIQLTRQVLGC